MNKEELIRLISTDFPDLKIDRDVIDNSVIASQRGYPTDVRIATGRVYTSKEYEAMRERVLSTPLP